MRRVLLALLLVLGTVSAVSAQARARLDIRLGPDARVGPDPEFRLANLFDDSQWKEALDNAYSIRLAWRVQSWRKRTLIDAIGAQQEWQVIVMRQPLMEEYQMVTQAPGGRPIEQRFGTLDSLKVALSGYSTLRSLRPRADGEWYYAVRVEISTLNDDELTQLQQFMSSSGREAAQDGGSRLQRFLMRLGLPEGQILTGRSPTFRVGPP